MIEFKLKRKNRLKSAPAFLLNRKSIVKHLLPT